MKTTNLRAVATLALQLVLPGAALAEHAGAESEAPDSLLGLEARRLRGGPESLDRYLSKVHVKGPDAHPVYAYETSLREPIGGAVQWNFEKYLIDRNGKFVARYESRVSPRDARLVGEVERLLAETRPESPRAGVPR